MRSLVFLAILLAADPAWLTFVSKTGKYSVDLPGKAQEKANKLGKLTVYTVEAPLGSDSRLKVFFFETGLAEKELKQEGFKNGFLDEARDQLLKDTKGKLGKEAKIEVDGHPGRDFEMSLDKGAGAVRANIYLVDLRLYTLIVQGKSEKVIKSAEADKFFKSFKLTK
jgi:hypothetical protein